MLPTLFVGKSGIQLTDLGYNQRVFLFSWEGAAPGDAAGHKAGSVGYLAVGTSPGAPKLGWAERRDHSFAVRLKPRAHGQEAPGHPALAQQQQQWSPGGWWPLWHRGAGEGISNLEVGSETILMVRSTGLKTGMINKSNAMEEPESKQ